MRSAARRRIRRRVGRRLRRGAYLLPSLFTTGNMLLGFYAIVAGLHGAFRRAAAVVFIAGFLDGLDGRIARMTRTESEFGREFDSLADLLTFGAAPALLSYLWGLRQWGRAGWLIPFFYLVCAAARLARFNIQTRVVDSRFFAGLPSPAAAGTVCSLLFFIPTMDGRPWQILLALALVGTGTLMISTFRYRSFKHIDLTRRLSYRVLLPLAALVAVVATHPEAIFLALGVLYSLSGPLGWLLGRIRPKEPEPLPPEQAAEGPGAGA